MRYLVSYEYSGSIYHGWQKQPDLQTIQSILTSAFQTVLKHDVKIESCGRTDKGVSAFRHYISFVSHKDLNEEFIRYVNFILRDRSISLNDIQSVPDNFSIRYDCVKRSYLYRILNRKHPSPLMKDLSLFVYDKLSIEKMRDAAKVFIGTHDFNAFRSSDCQAKSSVRTIYNIDIQFNNIITYQPNEVIDIVISGNAFLHNMIRIIVSGLIMVGLGKLEVDKLEEILHRKVRNSIIKTMPPNGLFFLSADFVPIFK